MPGPRGEGMSRSILSLRASTPGAPRAGLAGPDPTLSSPSGAIPSEPQTALPTPWLKRTAGLGGLRLAR
jgi:hypothetical protein